ncbi:hypothetical protein COOONC_24694 [Cooperia oncophora]
MAHDELFEDPFSVTSLFCSCVSSIVVIDRLIIRDQAGRPLPNIHFAHLTQHYALSSAHTAFDLSDYEGVVKTLQDAGQTSVNWVENAAQDTGKFLKRAGQEVSEQAKEAWNTAGQKADELGNKTKAAASNVADRSETAAKDVKNWAAGAVDTIKQGGEDAGGRGSTNLP